MEIALQELATRFGLELRGDPTTKIRGICALAPGQDGCIAFLSDQKLERQLEQSRASAVILKPSLAGTAKTPVLVTDNPLLAYARIASLWNRQVVPTAGVHPSAFVDPKASIDPTASIGPNAVVLGAACIGPNVEIGPGCVIGNHVEIGTSTRLVANVTIMDHVRIGARVTIEPGAVIGGRGFGLVQDGQTWVEVPQLGSVCLGDDVEIGANVTIDRGAIEDTVIEQGVKIDSQVHIAHNCRIGAHSVIAGCSAIAGSVTIGRNCILAGAVGVVDHVTLADNVVVTARSLVTRDLDQPGMYSSSWGALPVSEWRRQVAGVRRMTQGKDKKVRTTKHKQGERE